MAINLHQVWKISEVKICPSNAFSIAKIGRMVKNEILVSTSILSFLGVEMIKISGLPGTELG